MDCHHKQYIEKHYTIDMLKITLWHHGWGLLMSISFNNQYIYLVTLKTPKAKNRKCLQKTYDSYNRTLGKCWSYF